MFVKFVKGFGAADKALIDFSCEKPANEILKNKINICHKHLPENIINRPKKGFGIPIADWLKGTLNQLMNDLLSDLEKSSKFGMLMRAMQNGFKYKAQTGMSMAQTVKTAWGMASKTDMTLGQTMMAGNAPIIIQKAMVEGKPDEGVLPSGQIAGLIDDLPNCADIIGTIIQDAEASLKRVGA